MQDAAAGWGACDSRRMQDERRRRGIEAYASQLELPPDEVVGWFTGRFGERFAEEAFAAAGGAWTDEGLSLRDRSLVVVAALVTLGGLEQRLRPHLRWAVEHGCTRAELEAAVALLGRYAGEDKPAAALALVREELG